MWKKLLLNIIYTIGIVISLYTIYWGFNNKNYMAIIAALFVGALCVILKIGIMKEVRAMERPVPPPPAAPKKKK